LKIPFNKPMVTGKESEYIHEVIKNLKVCGDGAFTHKCHNWMEKTLNCQKALLTTSCTHALEMAAILADIQPGDEVIMPSYTFVSTANAFVLRGAKIVFVDIRPDTMNMDERLVEDAITEKTRVIVPVHYAGVACEMDAIMDIADRYDLLVIEDAAQAVMSRYKGRYLGTIGDMGCYSFHETKNYTCGEGGALIINNERFIGRAEIIREKGTNRSAFYRGQVDKYTWVDIGSSYLPSELNAACLYAQLEMAEEIKNDRMAIWQRYYNDLVSFAEQGIIEIPYVPTDCYHNAHMFYVKVKDLEERSRLISYMGQNGVSVVFHYLPLHTSTMGSKYGRFNGIDRYTTKKSEQLVRLPMYYGLHKQEQLYVLNVLNDFTTKSK